MATPTPEEKAAAEQLAAEQAAAELQKPVTVIFEKSWSIYNRGEKATFPAERADWMVSVKIAVKA